MNNSEQYWKDRVLKGQKKAIKIGNTFNKKQKKLYKKSYNTVINYLNNLLADINAGEEITRSQLYTAEKYLAFIEAVDKSATAIGNQQIKDLEKAVNDTYKIKIGFLPNRSKEFNQISDNQTMQLLNTYWSGKSFKTRIGINANQFAGRVKDKVTESIILGRSPDRIKSELMKEYDIAYHVADRLVRTETAYAYNQASIDQYKQEGVQKVKILKEANACEICSGFDTKPYLLGTEPFLPAHPNCRCCYIPVIEENIVSN